MHQKILLPFTLSLYWKYIKIFKTTQSPPSPDFWSNCISLLLTIYSYRNLVLSISPLSFSPFSLYFLSIFCRSFFQSRSLIRSSYWKWRTFFLLNHTMITDPYSWLSRDRFPVQKNSWGAKDWEDERGEREKEEKEEKEKKEEKERNNCDSIILLIFTRKWEGWFLMKWKMLIHFFLLIRSLIKPLNLDYKNDFLNLFIIFLLTLSLSFSLSLLLSLILSLCYFLSLTFSFFSNHHRHHPRQHPGRKR